LVRKALPTQPYAISAVRWQWFVLIIVIAVWSVAIVNVANTSNVGLYKLTVGLSIS